MRLLLFCFFFALSGLSVHAQIITTIAGSGARGFSGDYDTATSAQLCKPRGVALDRQGNVFIADRENNRIRKITFATGIITTVAGADSSGVNGEGIAATTALLQRPSGVAVDAAGNIYISDETNRILRVSTQGIITTIAGTGNAGYAGDGGPATAAQLNAPADMIIDDKNTILFADAGNNRIRKIDAAGIITTLAGTGAAGFGGDGGPATTALLNAPTGLCIDGSGNLFVADALNHRIRKVSAAGTINTVAGTGTGGLSNDTAIATTAKLNEPGAIAIDGASNLYITDCANHRIRKIIAESGMIVTIAGTGESGYTGDGGNATAATLFYPACIALDNMGNVYFSDLGNHCIRKIKRE